MNISDDGFLQELLGMFKIEAEEHVKSISTGLLDFEKSKIEKERNSTIELIFRETHSLKGASRAVGLIPVETVCQVLESVFAVMKKHDLREDKELFDVLHNAVDLVGELIEKPDNTDISEIMKQLAVYENKYTEAEKNKNMSQQDHFSVHSEKKAETKISDDSVDEPKFDDNKESKNTVNPEAIKMQLSDTVRLPTAKLDVLLFQAEELLGTKLAVNQYVNDLKDISLILEFIHKEWEKNNLLFNTLKKHADTERRRDNYKLLQSVDSVKDFLNWNYDQIKTFETKISGMIKIAESNARLQDGMVNNLLEDMKHILMLPFSNLLKIMPKIVRDLSRDQHKEIQLLTKGSTIEVDRRILEELKDPMIHLIRNAVDHGLEKPEIRKKMNKSESGMISISVSELGGNKVEVLISDDGKGIDVDKIKQTAVERGIISQSRASDLTYEETLELIFLSELSTSLIITDISGRGLGMAIVREKVEKLGGSINIETEKDIGTTFKIILPVTMATFRGILVQVSEQIFVVPTHQVDRTIRVPIELVKTVKNKETITIDGQTISFVYLSDVLELPRSKHKRNNKYIKVMILTAHGDRIAFYVDDVLNEQEVLVKGMGTQLKRVRNIAGATILGNGKVVTILNVSDLIKSAMKVSELSESVVQSREEIVEKKSILIAEDSITSRTLLKNILTTAGYNVRATVDGIDAFTALRSADFDLVVSDVEMPRMNGFELVSKIRSTDKFVDLPVILVTGLESREDRERGIEVGANAYIVKRSFDQSNLLNVIKKLI